MTTQLLKDNIFKFFEYSDAIHAPFLLVTIKDDKKLKRRILRPFLWEFFSNITILMNENIIYLVSYQILKLKINAKAKTAYILISN